MQLKKIAKVKVKSKSKRNVETRPLQMNYCSSRWSGEITDCSMPMTFEQYDHCSFNCLYCFSWYQKALKAFNPLFPNEHGKNYQSSPIRSVNPEMMRKLFDLEYKTGPKGQFREYIRQGIAMQWGGLCDPFDGYEKQYGIGLEILKILKKKHYPICFSTKRTWWTEGEGVRGMNNNEDAIYGVECCNSDCNWQGLSNECVTFKHGGPLLCPECHEVVERVD